MKKVVVKVLQGTVLIQKVFGGLTMYPAVANFLQCICTKNYESWLAVRQTYCNNKTASFLSRPLCLCLLSLMCTIMARGCEEQLFSTGS